MPAVQLNQDLDMGYYLASEERSAWASDKELDLNYLCIDLNEQNWVPVWAIITERAPPAFECLREILIMSVKR